MTLFIEARTEPFEEQREATAQAIRESGRDYSHIRRPTRGIQIKEDTYAVIRVMGPDGEFMPVIDAAGETYSEEEGGQVTTHYSNFFVQQVVEERHEKQQIVETFGESYIFFFGEAPRMLMVSGFLLNTADFNWRAEFWENYERYFRGTKLVELGARLYFIYDDQIVEGYMVGANAQEQAAPNPYVLPFQFQFFVTGHTNISRIGDPNFPAPTDIDYAQLSSYERAIQNWQRGRNLQRELSTQAVLAANRQAYVLGTGKHLADTIRSNIINAGDPSITGFISRAYRAVQIVRQDAITGETTTTFRSEPTRWTALRTTFADNLDEFIGRPEPSARELAEPLSMADRWLEMDRAVNNSILGLVQDGEFDFSERSFWDLMGRAGRAEQTIRREGGYRASGTSIRRGLLVGAGVQRDSPVHTREIPFGMSASDGELV